MRSHPSLLLLLLLLALFQTGQPSFSLISDNPTMNGRAKITYYGFNLGFYSTAVKITLTFPTVFVISAADAAACQETSTGASGSCTLSNNTLTYTMPTSLTYSDDVTFTVYVTNPPYSDQFDFKSSIIGASGIATYSETGNYSLVAQGNLGSSTVVYTPTNTNAASTFTFQFTTANLVPVGGSLFVKFSYGSVNSTASLTIFNTTVMNSSVAVVSGLNNGVPIYFFSSIFNNGLPIGSVIKFSLSKVTCPPTTDPTSYNVTVATTYLPSSTSIIDSTTLLLAATTDSTIANAAGSISNFLVGDNRVASLDLFTPTQIVWATDTIQVTTDSGQSTYLTVSTSPSNFANYNLTPSITLNISSVTSGMKIYAPSTTTNTISAGVGVQFTAGIRIKSQVSSGVKYFTVQLLRNGYSYAAATATPITVKPNTLSSVTYSSLTPIVSKTTTYTFTITIKNPLGAQAALKITLPSEMSIATGTCVSTTTTIFSSFTYNQTCSTTSTTAITIQNITNTILLAGTSFSITVAGITNPISTKTTATPFVLETYYSGSEMGGAVDDTNSASLNSTLTVTASALIIGANDFNISRNSTTNLAYALYTITYRVNSRFKASGYITISFPSSVTLSSSNSSKFKLTYANGSNTADTAITPTSTINTVAGTNTLLFNFSSSIIADLATNTLFTITVDSLQNYPSLKPINPQIKIFSSDGFAIEESSTSSLSVTNDAENTGLGTIITTSSTSLMNGQSTTCTFQLTTPASLASGSLITLELEDTGNVNTQMYLGTSLTCLAGGASATCSQDTTNSRLLKITTSIAITSNFVVSVSSIILSRSFDTPGKIFFRVFETVGTSNYNISSGSLTPPTNTLTNAIKSISLNILDSGGAYPSQLNQLQTFQITITPTNRLQSGDIIVVTLPAEYFYVLGTTTGNASLSTGSLCTVSSDFHCSNNNSSPLSIRIVEKIVGTGFGNVSSVKITINNGTYRSPQLWSTYNSNIFLAYTYSSTGKAVDTVQAGSVNTTFYLACTNTSAHCKTCTGTLCDSCYQVGTGYETTFAYGGFFYKTSTKECVTSCAGNFYNLSNTCQLCQSPCYGCSVSASNCTSCVNSTYKFFNNSCLTGCPNGYYADTSNICQTCSGNCLTCSVTASNCTSCTNSYLSTVTSSCVSSTGCESYQYPDSASFKCTNCSASCVDCTTNSTLCKSSCSTGYIIDIKYNTNNLFPAQCTNVCPDGKVNDTTNSLGQGVGCRCNSSVCATCVTTVNTCLTCAIGSGLYLKNTSCLSSCGTGYYVSNNTTCQSCPSTCSSCSSSTICTGCLLSGYWVYNGLCVNACIDRTTKAIVNGSYVCITCSSGCSSCQSETFCTSCSSPNYIENMNGSQYCTPNCNSNRVLYGTSCLANCPAGYMPSSAGVCVADNTTSSSNATITSTLTSSSSRFVPFPTTIGLLILSITTLASKVALPYTIVPAGLCAFGGLAQIIAWFIFIIAAGINSSSSYPLTNSGMIIVLIALIINWTLNAISLYFFKKYIWDDTKFQANLKKLRNKTKTGVSVTYTCFVVTAVFSHKFAQILFSNLFEAGYFIYKVEDKVKLTPLNYIRYISLVASVLAIIGAAAANYEYQTLSMDSFVFIQSIDLIIVTLLAAIASLWATVRKSDDYQNVISQKRNDMQEELQHDPIEDDAHHYEKQAKMGNSRSKYIHSSMTSKIGDPRDDPLNPKQSSRVNPIGVENNLTNMPLDNKDEEDGGRINLNDMSNITTKNRGRIDDGLDLDEIQLDEDTGNDLLPRRPTINKPKITESKVSERHKPKENSVNPRYIKKDLNSPSEKDKQKQKLKDNIENQLTADEIQRTKVIKDVNEIDVNLLEKGSPRDKMDGSESLIKQLDENGIKKQKLETLSNTDSQELNKLPENERGKAGEIKTAMSLLQAKKVNIGEYLKYLDIIEEEDEDKNSDEFNENPKNRGKKVKIDKTKRKIDKELFIHDFNNDFDDEPRIPDFNHSPIRGKNPTDAGDISEFDDFHRLSSLKKSGNNRSEQLLKKNKNVLDDLVLITHESGDNYDLSLGDEFQRGNTLQPVDKDELPPSNLYQTEKLAQDGRRTQQNSVPIGKDRIVPNHLLYDGDHIEFVQSQGADSETVKGDIIDFNNDISPSQFNQPNLRIQSDEVSEAPTKPKFTKKGGYEGRGRTDNIDNNANGRRGFGLNGKDEALQIEDIENDEDEFNHEYDNDMPSRMNRYQSNRVLDYDEILHNKKQNEKMKKLEEIYLPRINVNKNEGKKKRINHSSHTHRKDELK